MNQRIWDKFLTERDKAVFAAGAPRETLPTAAEAGLTVTDFRALTADFAHHNIEHQEEERRSAAEKRQHRVKYLIDHHIADESWRSILPPCPRGGRTWRER